MATRGINCRFGMKGNIAEADYDSSCNFIALFNGERRYIWIHPKNCLNIVCSRIVILAIGTLRWIGVNAPDLEAYPKIANENANEVVLQAGNMLYLSIILFRLI